MSTSALNARSPKRRLLLRLSTRNHTPRHEARAETLYSVCSARRMLSRSSKAITTSETTDRRTGLHARERVICVGLTGTSRARAPVSSRA